LRPGEKLREELVAMDEALTASLVDKIQRVQSAWVPELEFLQQKIDDLERLANNGQCRSAVDLLCQLVPTFRPVNTEASNPLDRQRLKNRLKKLRIASQSASAV
jgi:FlaA1/EpsC-like NDP-sugar epimerase